MNFRVRTSRDRGQSFVELAISVVVLAVLAFGAVDLSKSISTFQRMSSVGREGGRVFLKSNFDTTNITDTLLRSDVETKVYNLLKQAMLPENLDANGGVIITVARRVERADKPTTPDDQLKITHVFKFGSASSGAVVTRIKDDPPDTYISGSLENDPDFIPLATVRRNEELVIVEMFYTNEFMTPIADLVPGLSLSMLYDRTVF
jgi:Flp pilus assembly protein TadG